MISRDHPLVLGSQSPRRRSFIEQLGLEHVTSSPGIDETARLGESPGDYVERIANEKLAATLGLIEESNLSGAAALAADTVVTLDSKILGKPENDRQAVDMLTRLSGREHEVMSAYAIMDLRRRTRVTRRVTTEVRFREIPAREIEAYVASGEGRDKAGSYAIQGRGASLVLSIRGSYTNVVGLPLAELVVDLRRLRLIVD